MRSLTYVQPGETLSCVGCHEPRQMAGPLSRPHASRSQPARLTMPPSGAWPYRFARLVQPVLDRECVSCHSPGGPDARASALDLTGEKAYDSLTNYGSPSLHAQVTERYMQGASTDGDGTAAKSALLAAIRDRGKHPDLEVSRDGLARICLWMDTYAQRAGSFSEEQERNLEDLRERWAYMLEPRTED